ncbi:MAG: ATP-binding protein [Tepidisphaerales bacterium]
MDRFDESPLFPMRVLLTVLAIIFAVETGVMFLLPVLVHGGVPIWVENFIDSVMLTVIAAPLLMYVLVAPLHRVARVERAKAASIVQTAPDGIITADADGAVLSFNRAAEQIFGCAADQVVGTPLSRLLALPPQPAGATSPGGVTLELPGRRASGAAMPLAVSMSEVSTGKRTIRTLIVRDLTDRKRAEAELATRATQQSTVAELGQRALVADDDLPTLLLDVAYRLTETLGVRFSAFMTYDAAELRVCTGFGWKKNIVARAAMPSPPVLAATGWPNPRPLVWSGDSSARAVCAGTFLADHAIESGCMIVIPGPDQPFGVLGVFSDGPRQFGAGDIDFLKSVAHVIAAAAQRQRNEMQRRQHDVFRAEQMSAVAQVAAGVVHEIRNPLTSIKLLVQSREGQGTAGLAEEDREVVVEEIRRIEHSLQTFLDFARPPEPQRRRVDLRELVSRTIALVRGRAGHQKVAVRFEPPPSPVPLRADAEQIQQLLLNLALNALDEMPRGGELRYDIIADERGAEVRVSDTGRGIAPQVLARLFEAFVTGKETGTGLGLAVSRRIAEQHCGSLSGHNRHDGGACFVLRLPLDIEVAVEENPGCDADAFAESR